MEVVNNDEIMQESQVKFNSKKEGFRSLEEIAIDTLSENDDSPEDSYQQSNNSQKGASSENSTEPQKSMQTLSLKNIKSKEQIEIQSKQNQEILHNLNFNIDDLFKKISSLTEQIKTDFQPRPLKQRQTSIVQNQTKNVEKPQFRDWLKIQQTPLFEFKSELTITEIKSNYKPIFFQLPQQKRKEYSIDMKLFQTGKSLGCGKFGQVVQCRNTKTNCIYALKKIFKSVVDEYCMQEQLLTQLKILNQINHPNIVKAYESFTDDFHIFIVMEYIHGDMLVKKLKCTQNQCKIIIRQVLEALKYLHEKKIAHRDIKPQNIIITADNIVKICDFGWAAQDQEPMKILCGTLDYISPQMAAQQPYSHKVDLWNLGVLTFELIHGYPPFKSSSKSRIFQKVKNLEFFFSDQIQISQQCKSFINGFLKKQSERQSLEWGINHQFLKIQENLVFNDEEFHDEISQLMQ